MNWCNQSNTNNNRDVGSTYSSIVKKKNEVIVVKPANDKQNCQQTQQEMKDKINLNKITVGVDKIRNISKGGVVINCTSKESKEKLKNTVKKELGNKYQVIEPKPVNPKIIIVGTESEMMDKEDKNVLESIISQNDLESIDGNCTRKYHISK
ncbi:hypothetical protein QE152_g18991 [Popillia japonica]|uniref:Uncharacterized protein n=1 Tax=Popillia japonica TaxID=7064 RepID=A0AAW1L4U2_POPJA